jgi:hypothetical protein
MKTKPHLPYSIATAIFMLALVPLSMFYDQQSLAEGLIYFTIAMGIISCTRWIKASDNNSQKNK